MTFQVRLSVLTSADRPAGLQRTFDSLTAQSNSRWQWCVLVAPQAASETLTEANRLAAQDPRLDVIDGTGMSAEAAIGTLLDSACGPLLCWLGLDQTLDPNSVGTLAAEAEEIDWLYTDEGFVRPDGTVEVWFKPDWSPELLRSQPYASNSAVLARRMVLDVGGLDGAAGSAMWYDLVLRVSEVAGPPRHVPGPFFLRSGAAGHGKPPFIDATSADRCRVSHAHCRRVGIAVELVEPVEIGGREIGQRVVRKSGHHRPVSVIIPTGGRSSPINGAPRCHVVELLRSLWTPQRYDRLEVIVVYDDGTPVGVLDAIRDITAGSATLVSFSDEFNFSRKCNAGALVAGGDYLCFLNDDMEVIEPRWLHCMAALLDDVDVGAVGAKLLFANGTLQHAGHVYYGGMAHHLMLGDAADSIRFGGVANLTSERSGVTAACLLIREDDFRAVGGFSELFPLNFNDVDLCLKIRMTGKRIIYEPAAVLYHYESQSREPLMTDVEVARIRRRWLMALTEDPYLNRLLRPSVDVVAMVTTR